jgi:4-methylaminobutanoate oxidase (formaldehyde-forming)
LVREAPALAREYTPPAFFGRDLFALLGERDGEAAGQVSSAAWGATTGSCVGLAYLRAADGAMVTPDWVGAGNYAVNVGGEVYPITVSLKAIYDPANDRVRG